MLYTIGYMSYASGSMTDQVIEDILQVAQENNKKLGITGMLFYASNTFMQVLEGDEKIVKELYNEIKIDSRHENVNILFEGELEARAFSEWSMAYKKLGDEEYSDLKTKINLDDPQLNNNLPAITFIEAFQELV